MIQNDLNENLYRSPYHFRMPIIYNVPLIIMSILYSELSFSVDYKFRNETGERISETEEDGNKTDESDSEY